MLSFRGRRRLSVLPAAALLAAMSGCGSTGQRASHVPSPISTRLLPPSQVPCHRAPGQESLDGPLDWQSDGTVTLGQTWAGSRPMDHGMINLAASKPIVLDFVTIAPQDPAIFAPVRVRGAWVTVNADPGEIVGPGEWPGRVKAIACQEVAPQPYPLEQRTLVVRLDPVVGAAAHGRRWAADRGVVLHYHTLDGTPYAAPFGYVVVFPTSRAESSTQGADLLDKLWFGRRHASAAASRYSGAS